MEEHVGRLQRIGVEVGEAILVAAAERRPRVLVALDPVQPLGHVPLPDRLPELAVVDDVDADLDLPAHDVGDGDPQVFLGSLPEKRRLRLGWSLERTDVRGQDARHRYPPRVPEFRQAAGRARPGGAGEHRTVGLSGGRVRVAQFSAWGYDAGT